MKVFALLALIGVVHSASVAQRFIPFLTGDKTSEIVAGAGGPVSADPIVLNETSAGKKITLTITKTIEKGTGGGHQEVVGGHQGHVVNPHGHVQQGKKGQLQVNLQDQSVKIDNATLQSMIEGLLGGNIQDVKITHPEMMHGKKPVAVIFSSAIHVVDLGVLEPEHPVTPAPVVAHPPHPQHNHTHDDHPLLNHTSLMNTLLSPLMMLSSLHSPPPPVAPVPQSFPMQSMAMQPVIMMMPATQNVQQPQAPMMMQPDQFQSMLASMMAAKTQLINSTLAAQSQLAEASLPAAPLHIEQPAPLQLAPLAVPAVQPLPGIAIHKKISKVVSINIDKDARNSPDVPVVASTEAATTPKDVEPLAASTPSHI
jgi:hypothetical protein